MHETAMMSGYLEVLTEDRFNFEGDKRPALNLVEEESARCPGITQRHLGLISSIEIA